MYNYVYYDIMIITLRRRNKLKPLNVVRLEGFVVPARDVFNIGSTILLYSTTVL